MERRAVLPVGPSRPARTPPHTAPGTTLPEPGGATGLERRSPDRHARCSAPRTAQTPRGKLPPTSAQRPGAAAAPQHQPTGVRSDRDPDGPAPRPPRRLRTRARRSRGLRADPATSRTARPQHGAAGRPAARPARGGVAGPARRPGPLAGVRGNSPCPRARWRGGGVLPGGPPPPARRRRDAPHRALPARPRPARIRPCRSRRDPRRGSGGAPRIPAKPPVPW